MARGMVMDIRAWIGLKASVVVYDLTRLHLFLADVSLPNFARNCLLPLSQGAPSWLEATESFDWQTHQCPEACWFWTCTSIWHSCQDFHAWGSPLRCDMFLMVINFVSIVLANNRAAAYSGNQLHSTPICGVLKNPLCQVLWIQSV